MKKWCSFALSFTVLLLSACGSTADPDAFDRGFDSGYEQGYDEGYSAGEASVTSIDSMSDDDVFIELVWRVGYGGMLQKLYDELGSEELLAQLSDRTGMSYSVGGGSDGALLPIAPVSSPQASADRSVSSPLPLQQTPSPASYTVYVSRNGVIHSDPHCSGMKYYTEMSYDTAIASGYRLCSKCY